MYRRRQQRRNGLDPWVIMLLVQLGQQVAQSPYKPPVTLALAGVNLAAFFSGLLPPQAQHIVPSIARGCLNPAAVLRSGQWGRLFSSAFLHGDEVHLYYNLASLLYKGTLLEARLGSLRFAALVAELLLLSQGLYVVGAALLAAHIPEYRPLYSHTCAVGLSGVLFALKAVLNWGSPGSSQVWGFTLPTKFMAWAELVIASLINPRASFFGHLCGIVAGLLHVACIQPAWLRLAASRRRFMQAAARRSSTPRFAAAHSSAVTRNSSRAHAATPQSAVSPADSSRAPIVGASMEELRQRRLQRFDGR